MLQISFFLNWTRSYLKIDKEGNCPDLSTQGINDIVVNPGEPSQKATLIQNTDKRKSNEAKNNLT